MVLHGRSSMIVIHTKSCCKKETKTKFNNAQNPQIPIACVKHFFPVKSQKENGFKVNKQTEFKLLIFGMKVHCFGNLWYF